MRYNQRKKTVGKAPYRTCFNVQPFAYRLSATVIFAVALCVTLGMFGAPRVFSAPRVQQSAAEDVTSVTIIGVTPVQGASDVDRLAPITVEFDIPVVSTQAITSTAQDPEQADELPQPLALTDDTGQPIIGFGRWLSPTLVGFYPESRLKPGTTYRATVDDNLTSDGQIVLDAPFTWEFTTDAHIPVSVYPYDGATEVSLDAPIEVRLPADVSIDTAATGGLLSVREIETGNLVKGSIKPRASTSNTDDKTKEPDKKKQSDGANTTYVFEPSVPLQRGMHYQGELNPVIKTTSGASLVPSKQSWAFATMGELEVAQVEPLPDVGDVMPTIPRISVHFNHPVVPLVPIGEQKDLPHPLTITPHITGTGRWLDTSTYIFSPTVVLTPSMHYHVEVAQGLEDQTGGVLHEGYTWNFTTIMPQIAAVVPEDEQHASPHEPITIYFNQPMDPAIVQQAIALRRNDTGSDVPATIEVLSAQELVDIPSTHSGTGEEDEEHIPVLANASIARITPAASLERGSCYTVFIADSVQAAHVEATLSDAYEAAFCVAPIPQLEQFEPADGSVDVDAHEGIVLNFSTSMDWQSVEQHITIEPAPTDMYTFTSDLKFTLYPVLQPETDYRVTVGAEARDAYGVAMGADESFGFRTAPTSPSLWFMGVDRIGSYDAHMPVRVPIKHINVSDVTYAIYRIDAPDAAYMLSDYDAWKEFAPGDDMRIQTTTMQLGGERNEETITLLDIGALEDGIYYLELIGSSASDISLENTVNRQIMVVSPYGVTIKRSSDHLFVWTVDLATGAPVTDLPLTVAYADYEDEETTLYQEDSGRSDHEGIMHAPFVQDETYRLFLWSSADPEGAETDEPKEFVFATTDWNDGIDPWSFDVSAQYERISYVGGLHTDRPIYRPRHTVYVRGAIRAIEGETYALPDSGQQVRLSVRDPSNKVMYSTVLSLGEFGTFDTSIILDSSATPGHYSIAIGDPAAEEGRGNFFHGSFQVAEYRKPAFEVTIEADKEDVVQGDTMELEIEAKYFAGGAVANAPVRWRLLAEPFTFRSETAPGYRFDNADDAYAWYRDSDDMLSGKRLVSEGTDTTDAEGNLSLSLPAQLGDEQHSSILTLDVEITDRDGQIIASRTPVRVHRGAFYIGLRPDGYVAQVGSPQNISLRTLDTDGNASRDHDLDIEIYRREWYSVREQGADGQMYWTSTYSETLVETQTATTDARGRASIAFEPDAGGSYRIAAQGQDAQGNTVQASAFMWAYGSATFWGVNDNNRIDLVADKDGYKPGDTAKVLIPAPYEDMIALVTLERNDIIEHEIVQLQDTTELFEVPITADYAPNVYFSVVLLKPTGDDFPAAEMRVGLINLPVSTEQQVLNIDITPDKEKTEPRSDVVYNIKATDYSGKGVQAELSLALVDKAVLTLADDKNPTLTEAFYQNRPLGVITSQSLVSLVNRVTHNLEASGKGGGGGLGSEAPIVRREFADTAYWNAALVTDEKGEVRVTVTLPDNLTTWRMTARGLTEDTLVGQTTSDIVSTLNLRIRPSLPRFLTVGDVPSLQAVIHNTSSRPAEVAITLEATGLDLSTDSTQTVEVPANGQTMVHWQASVLEAEQATLSFTLANDDDEVLDAIEQSIPIQRFITPETVATAGQVDDEPDIVKLVFSDNAQAPGGGQMDLELIPSLGAGVQPGLSYLQHFPHGCTEQTVSRFMPNAVTYRLLQQASTEDKTQAVLQARLERTLSQGLQRLYNLQQPDGGWSWWASGDSNPYLTAYVVHGLLEAEKAGYGIDRYVLKNALEYLTDMLNGDTNEEVKDALAPVSGTRAYVLFVMAEADQADYGRTVALFERRAGLPVYGRAYLLMTLHALGGEDARVQTLISEMMSSAIVHATSTHWEESQADRWAMSSNVRSTALALQALVRTSPDNFLIPNAVRYLMDVRQNGHWRTTQETATALMALSEYVVQHDIFDARYTYLVTLDEEELAKGNVGRSNMNDTIEIVVDLADRVADQQQADEDDKDDEDEDDEDDEDADGQQIASLALQRKGQGTLYYNLRVRSFADADDVEALDQGLAVQRAYMAVDPVTLQPTGEHVDEVQVGDVVQVQLTLDIPEHVHYLVVEDMLPAGLEALDSSLKTVSDVAEDAQLERADEDKPSWWYFAHTEIYDNRVALFANSLASGTYHYSYLARAAIPGTYQTLPAVAYQMYAPEVFGRSDGTRFVVGGQSK